MLHSYQKRRNPSSFGCTFLNRHRLQVERSSLRAECSHIYFYLPSTTDRSEKINRHMGSVNLLPVDLHQNSFKTGDGILFDPSKLDFHCQEKEVMTIAVVKMLKKIQHLSIINLVKNADGLIATENIGLEVEWISETGKGLPQNKYKMSY